MLDSDATATGPWVVATLGVRFDAPFGRRLVFKGGTSPSKVWRAIGRFSECIGNGLSVV